MGFPKPVSPFFPSQSGIFLLALGLCYLLALRDVALVKVIIVSKALAVVFLVTHAFLGAPPVVWTAATGDAAMLALTLVTLREARQRAAQGESA